MGRFIECQSKQKGQDPRLVSMPCGNDIVITNLMSEFWGVECHNNLTIPFLIDQGLIETYYTAQLGLMYQTMLSSFLLEILKMLLGIRTNNYFET